MQIFKKLSKKTLLEITAIAWPMAINAVLLQSVPVIDLLLIAPLGEVSLAAFGVAGAIIAFILGLQMGIASGTQFILSRAIGAGNVNRVGEEVAAGWVLNITFSVLAFLALFFGSELLVDKIIHTSEVAVQATEYIDIAIYLLFFSSVSQVIVVYFNSYKKTRIPLYGFLLEIPFNVVCSLVLIYGMFGAPEMGLAGAALGSVAAVLIRVFYLAFCLRKEIKNGLVSGFGAVNFAIIRVHLAEVTPVVLNFFILFAGHLFFQLLFAQLSVASYAAITLIMPWIKIGGMFANSWAKASTIIVSQYIGQENFKLIPSFVRQSKLVATLMSLTMTCFYFFFSIAIPYIYTNLSPETIVALAIIAPCYIFIPIFRTNNMFCGNMIRAMGEGYIIVRINLVTMWLIALPLCALLIYLEAPLFVVFGIVLFDEVIKCYKFRKTLMTKLDSYIEV